MISDKQLVERICEGRPEELEPLIGRYKDDLYRFCRHLTLNSADAEDLFQDVWVRVIRKLHRYDCERPFKAWLFQVTLNLYRDSYRNWKKRWRLMVLEPGAADATLLRIKDTAPLMEEKLLQREERAELEICLRRLPKRYLAPLTLYYYEEFSYEEIAYMLDIPLGTVKSRLNQGKKLLKEILKVGKGGT